MVTCHVLPLFPLGECRITPGALQVLADADVRPLTLLRRHQRGDWGDVGPEDAAENEYSVPRGLRIISWYTVADERLMVLTEADRSATTILRTDEY
jgi:hypothetical protein